MNKTISYSMLSCGVWSKCFNTDTNFSKNRASFGNVVSKSCGKK